MKRLLKPQVLGDILKRNQKANRSWDVFGPLAPRVNLAEERTIRIPLTKIARWTIGIVAGSVPRPSARR